MLTIRAVSFKGRPLDRELSARFEEAGGTIGRGEINTLVLPDPERFISRTHATISFQAGGYLITDTGTKNPVVVNGRPLGSGSQARLSDGDQIKVGDYLLQVILSASSAPLAASSSAAAAAPSPFDPFADLLAPPDRSAPRAAPVIPPAPSRPAANAPLIPEYADPLAGIRAPEPSIDDLIGPKSSPPAELLPADFLSEKPAAPPKGGGGTLDDLLDLFPRKPTQPPSVPDHGQEIFTPYTPPAARPEAAVKPEPPAVKPSVPPVLPQPGAPGKPSVPAMPSVPTMPSAPATPTTPPPTQSVSVAPSGLLERELLRAFLQGAGIPAIQAKNLGPETMEAIGKLLREAVQGTLDLLRARGLTKSEMRADMTMIMAQDNNPLKFSPTVEAALGHLLATQQVHGFMPPLRAMKDAYDDLRAHQLGFLAGMRAALEEVLARFAPQELGKRLTDQSMLDDLLPMNRKAKLWDIFLERHAAISSEAREDFNAAFGKAFRRAYDAQVRQLRGERK
jgi:type VI secretion system FHA domain protein